MRKTLLCIGAGVAFGLLSAAGAGAGAVLMDRASADQHSPARAEVQCDAFDVDVHPHDVQSNSDADEFAQYLTAQRICRMDADVEKSWPVELRCGDTVVMVYAKAETLQGELDEAARLVSQFREGGQCSWANE